MNRKIKAYQAIIYIVLFYLAAVLFLLGPGKLLEKDRLLAGAENPVGTVEVREDQQVQQVNADGESRQIGDQYDPAVCMWFVGNSFPLQD